MSSIACRSADEVFAVSFIPPSRPVIPIRGRHSRGRRRAGWFGLGKGSPQLALYEWEAAAQDAGVSAEGSGFRGAYDNLAYSYKREHMRAIESAKKPETRQRRIEKAIATLQG
ncbi:YdeI/OmpD-associated family protein [Microtetraspora glauca]|uniref:YdeI/OmpD-associated family protein n=1 Tax=Microtetraspora glauca TaxID=1996 RepID=A0ABV3GMZ8_MICGL